MKTNKIIAAVVAIMLLSACEDTKFSDVAQLSLSKRRLYTTTEALLFDAAGKPQTLKVNAENTSWKLDAPGNASWLMLSQTSGNSSADIVVTVAENTNTETGYSALLTLASQESDFGYSKPIIIEQSAAIPYIHYSPTTGFSFTPAAATKQLTISTNVDWEVTSSESWLTFADKSNNAVTLCLTENTGITRSATVKFRQIGKDEVLATIDVSQAEAGVECETESLTFNAISESKQITFASEATWTAYPDENCKSWIVVSPTQGSVGNECGISITTTDNNSSNSRSGSVIIAIGGRQKKAIPVNQKGASVTITPDEQLVFSDVPDSRQISLSSTIKWKATVNYGGESGWCKVEPLEGNPGDGIPITISVDENTLGKERTATILFGQEGFSASKTVTIRQSGKEFSISNPKLTFDYAGGTQEVDISTQASWKAVSDSQGWLSVSPASGTGNATIKITAQPYTKEDSRYGKIIVSAIGNDLPIEVEQTGTSIILNVDNSSFESNGGTIEFSFSATGKVTTWVAEEFKDWLSLAYDDTNIGTGTIKVTAKDNPSHNPREGKIFLQSGNQTIEQKFTQKGKTLTLNISSWECTAVGGTSGTVTVTTHGVFDVESKNPDWISIVDRENNTFKIKAEEYTGTGSREGSVRVFLTSQPEGEEVLEVFVPVIQAKKYANWGEPDKQITDSKRITVNYPVIANADWSVSSLDVTATWCTFTPQSGTGDGSIAVTLADNPSKDSRKVSLKLSSVDEDNNLTIEQPGRSLEVDGSEEISVGIDGGTSGEYRVTTDGTFDVSTSAEWLTVNRTGNTFTLTALRNTTYIERTAKAMVVLTETTDALPLNKTITVKQDGEIFSATQTTEFANSSKKQTVSIAVDKCNTSWSAQSTAGWISVSPISGGSGAATILLSVDANDSNDSREATVTITPASGNNAAQFTFVQPGAQLSVNPATLSVTSRGATETVTVTANGTWEVIADYLPESTTWNIVSGSMDGDATLSVNVPAYLSASGRNGKMVFKLLTTDSRCELPINQAPCYLRLLANGAEVQNLDYSVDGVNTGGVTSVEVETDAEWDVSLSNQADASWLHIAKNGDGNSFSITVDAEAAVELRQADITVRLTNLTEGSVTRSIHIRQGSSFGKGEYPDEEDWN